MKRVLLYSLCSLLILAAHIRAGLVVNEVLANEPGSAVSLEWIELYNDSPGLVNLSFVRIRVASPTDTTSYWLSGGMMGFEFLVICRDSVRFEEHWGDSSGLWGDDPGEAFQIREDPIGLTNSSGSVTVFQLATPVSELVWDQSGLDGRSWERVDPQSDLIEQSIDPTGSTPGRVNSHTPLPRDLALEDVAMNADSGMATLTFAIVNRGLTEITDAMLNLYNYDANATDSLGELIVSEAIGAIDTGFTVLLIGRYQFPGIYRALVAKLDDDDRNYNNRFDFTAPGEDYPPVILSEFLPNPTPMLSTEWVELKNVSSETIDLADWQLGDSTRLVAISPSTLTVQPGAYIVLAEDSLNFLGFYLDFVQHLHQPSQWPALNNNGDWLRLVDRFGIEADRFVYTEVFDSNYTWSRGETIDHRDDWGSSGSPGGSPGVRNVVRFSAEGSTSLKITLEPRIFSPDGDGRDDSTVIIVKPPEADGYDLKLYDSHGRLVRTFEEGAANLLGQYVWWGRDDGGRKLPIGIYVLYFEAEGVESIKKTVVIAR